MSYAANSQNWSYTQNLSGTTQDLSVDFIRNPARQTISRAQSNDLYGYTPPALSQAYVRNGLNQYTNVGGGAYAHDLRGNLTNDGARTLIYDLENRLTSASGPIATNLGYDPLGRLRTTTASGATTTFLYSGDQLVAEYNGSTLLRRYAFGAGIDRPIVWYEGAGLTNRNWLHADELGSVIATSDNAGAATIYSYGPYGEPANNNWTGSRFRYTGQIALPEIGLYYYKARAYCAECGRFLQTDPVGYEAGDMNLYAYVGNDPLNNFDPFGIQSSFFCGSDDPTAPATCSGGAEPEPDMRSAPRPRRSQGGRPLTQLESTVATEVGPGIDTDPVRVKYDAEDRSCILFVCWDSGPYTIGNVIHATDTMAGCQDFVACGGGDLRMWFAHEVRHVWQYQSGWNVIPERVWAFGPEARVVGRYMPLDEYRGYWPGLVRLDPERDADWAMWRYACQHGLPECVQ